MKPRVLHPNESYAFSQWFNLPYTPQDILADLEWTLERSDEPSPPYAGCFAVVAQPV